MSGGKQSFVLAHATARHLALEAVRNAPDCYVVEVRPKTRSLEQNNLLHSILADISKQVDWYGNRLSVDVWRRMCMASWLRESGEKPQLIPALDKNGFDVIYEKTSKLDAVQFSSLIEWCLSFAAEQGVKLKSQS
jgi:hypothetical protein